MTSTIQARWVLLQERHSSRSQVAGSLLARLLRRHAAGRRSPDAIEHSGSVCGGGWDDYPIWSLAIGPCRGSFGCLRRCPFVPQNRPIRDSHIRSWRSNQITILNVVVSVKRSHIQVPQRPIVTRSGCHLNVLREASLLNYSCKPVKVPKDPEIRSRSSVVVAKRRRGTEAKTASEHALRPRKGLALVRAIA